MSKSDLKNGYTNNNENNVKINCNLYNPLVDSKSFYSFQNFRKYYSIYMNNELFVEAYENCNFYTYQINQKVISISSCQNFAKVFPNPFQELLWSVLLRNEFTNKLTVFTHL